MTDIQQFFTMILSNSGTFALGAIGALVGMSISALMKRITKKENLKYVEMLREHQKVLYKEIEQKNEEIKLENERIHLLHKELSKLLKEKEGEVKK